MLDYKLIEALAMVVREGGFDKAARFLHLTQSAISQRVKLLEEQTGQILLVRASPPQSTPAGRRMIKHYLQVKRLEDDLLDDYLPSGREKFATLSIGINEDSLETWFLEAVRPFLENERVVLDLRSDDQDRTHRLLKDGEVIGCISAHDKIMQGCRIEYLGRMNYQLLATPDFAARWFPDGLSIDSVRRAPALVFNRKDKLLDKLFQRVLGEQPSSFPAHYLPSSGQFVDFIASGLAYGMLPDQQGTPLAGFGKLIDLAPLYHVPVKLFWHCWNLKSGLLEKFTGNLVKQAPRLLEK